MTYFHICILVLKVIYIWCSIWTRGLEMYTIHDTFCLLSDTKHRHNPWLIVCPICPYSPYCFFFQSFSKCTCPQCRPDGTPYAGGVFLFDIYFPPNYPSGKVSKKGWYMYASLCISERHIHKVQDIIVTFIPSLWLSFPPFVKIYGTYSTHFDTHYVLFCVIILLLFVYRIEN